MILAIAMLVSLCMQLINTNFYFAVDDGYTRVHECWNRIGLLLTISMAPH